MNYRNQKTSFKRRYGDMAIGDRRYAICDMANNTRTREQVNISKVDYCDVCGEDLVNAPCTEHERRTKIYIIYYKVVEHVDAQIKQCPTCDSTIKGKFPSNMHGPLQYGDGLKAFVINLLGAVLN